MKKILIDENSIFKIKIENKEEFSSSFFRDTYLSAAKIFNELIKENIVIGEYNDKEVNNIISFDGERGAGKTSVMKSFIKSLQDESDKFKLNDEEEDEEKWAKKFKKQYIAIQENKYEVLKTIDPSLFDDRSNIGILEIIIAEIFKNFKKIKNECPEKGLALMKKFQKVYKGLRILKCKDKQEIYNEHEDDLEFLLDLTDGILLKNDLDDLIKSYLQYIDKDVLVIPIDDLDMNIPYAGDMLEDIRKYLLIHNVIIVMAVKIKQLKKSVEQKYAKGFKDSIDYNINLNNSKENNNEYEKKGSENVKVMAKRYIEKIIPVERRIILPKLNSTDIDEIKININKNEKPDKVKNIREIIKIKLFEKLNIIMLFDDQNDKLIPKTLRGIIDLLKILYSMDNIDKDSDDSCLRKIKSKKLKNNVDIFRSYILEEWCDENLKGSHYEFLKEIDEIKPELVNRRIVHHLGGKIIKNLTEDKINNKKNDKEKEIESELLTYAKTISDREVNYKNISIGEVNTCIYIYDKITFKEETKRFILALKLIYTLKLLKLRYCEKDGVSRIKDVFAGDFFGEYFNLRKIKHKFIFKSKIEIKENTLRVKLNRNKIDNIDKLIEDEEFAKELEYDNQYIYIKINKLIQKLDIVNKHNELAYLYSLIIPQFPQRGYLGNLFEDDKCYEYEILRVNSSSYSKFYFKPLNILSSYIYLDDIDNRISNAKCEVDEDSEEKTKDKLDSYIEDNVKDRKSIIDDRLKNLIIDLVTNQDFFMKITENLDEGLNNIRFDKGDSIEVERIINNISSNIIKRIDSLLDEVSNNEKGKLKYIDDYKVLISKISYLNDDLNNEFIRDNISINNKDGQIGCLGYYNSEKINHSSIIEELLRIKLYLYERGLYNAGSSISIYMKSITDKVENIIEAEKDFKDIKPIFNWHKEELKRTRLALAKTDSESTERRIKISELVKLIDKLIAEIEKGA